jgi:hypothetical protein
MRFWLNISMIMAWGCLPPPRPWLHDTGPSGPPVGETDADSDADTDTDVDADADDTSQPPLDCNSLGFGSEGYLLIHPESIGGGELFHDHTFTVELWAWFEEPSVEQSWTLVSLGDPEAWWLGLESGQVVFRSGADQVTGPVPANGKWHHIAGVIDGSVGQMRLYVDGTRVGVINETEPLVAPTSDQRLHVGRQTGSTQSWDGLIDELRFGHTVLQSGESADGRPERPLADWLGVWRFDFDLVNAVTGSEAQYGPPSDPEPFWFSEGMCP